MDGLRRNLASAYTKAVEGFREAGGLDHDDFDSLKKGLDELRQMIGALFCVYSLDPYDLMTNMADEADELPYADPKDTDEGEEVVKP